MAKEAGYGEKPSWSLLPAMNGTRQPVLRWRR